METEEKRSKLHCIGSPKIFWFFNQQDTMSRAQDVKYRSERFAESRTPLLNHRTSMEGRGEEGTVLVRNQSYQYHGMPRPWQP
jgi:hypothetical protein